MTQVSKPKVLVVEDEASARDALVQLLEGPYEVRGTDSAEQASFLLEGFAPDVLVTDVRLPGESGLELVRRAKARIPECVVLVMTAYSSVEVAVEAMRAGAKDFVVKPVNFEAFELVLARELEAQKIALEVKRLRERLVDQIRDEEIWGESPEIQSVLREATDVAGSMATVLITGESGTGKEMLARFLHRNSSRRAGPFVGVNSGAIPETLLESEFFGHEKGSFTGAIARRAGRFERANGGTIFLDEIAELPTGLQVKLLRVLQERQLERVGGGAPIPIDVRVVAATNRDLEAMLSNGAFREDLYYRLNVFRIHMPPLRDRKSDIATLWSRFIERYARRESLPIPSTSSDMLQALYSYDWPGNIRELENVAERAVILSHGREIQPAHLPLHIRSGKTEDEPSGLRIPGSKLSEVEKIAILRTLASVGGSTSKAADVLGISVRKIQYRLREWRGSAKSEPPASRNEPS
ncbi:MAG: sigma-54-dependent Fis family transcriptional regulator [Deltaproteobacteria bacterium]|nr:sigma-54-dependent Fis family transcriptional regulator [Deltaproteobacteria bacterium]